jgi:hypothetical protein
MPITAVSTLKSTTATVTTMLELIKDINIKQYHVSRHPYVLVIMKWQYFFWFCYSITL